jgi:hypothetical protein
LVRSALNASNFFGKEFTEARDATSRLQNEQRDEDRDGVYGFESRAQRALQTHVQLCR